MSDPVQVPEEVLAHITPINDSLNHSRHRGSLVPYLLNPDRHSNSNPDWRCTLVDSKNRVLVSHLQWQQLHWHLVEMVMSGFEEQASRNFRLGQVDAVNRIQKHNMELLGLK